MAENPFRDPFSTPRHDTPKAPDVPSAPTGTTTEFTVPLAGEQAVEAFLDYPHLWWPVGSRAQGEDSQVALEDSVWIEEGADGQTHRWGTVTETDATGLTLTWYGPPAGSSTGRAGAGTDHEATVRIAFAARATDSTNVSVTADDPQALHTWREVLGSFERFCSGSS